MRFICSSVVMYLVAWGIVASGDVHFYWAGSLVISEAANQSMLPYLADVYVSEPTIGAELANRLGVELAKTLGGLPLNQIFRRSYSFAKLSSFINHHVCTVSRLTLSLVTHDNKYHVQYIEPPGVEAGYMCGIAGEWAVVLVPFLLPVLVSLVCVVTQLCVLRQPAPCIASALKRGRERHVTLTILQVRARGDNVPLQSSSDLRQF